ncbi:MAG: ABC transporter ATP-binding protein, partial [Syntrophomonas sp.]
NPSSGQVYIRGRRVNELESKKATGYLPELFRLYDWLTAREYLVFNARLYGISAREINNAVARAFELVGLKGREKEKIQGYSKGMQQRLALAAAILHSPPLVFLDEPTSALDPVGRREVRDIISRLSEQGTTVFLNSHLLSEVEMTCTHLGFIRHGELIAQGETKEFMRGNEEITEEITIEADGAGKESLRKWQQEGKLSSLEANKMLFKIRREETPWIIKQLVEDGASIYRVEVNNRGLEDVFLDLMKE